jgi:hypothetical protein
VQKSQAAQQKLYLGEGLKALSQGKDGKGIRLELKRSRSERLRRKEGSLFLKECHRS